MRRFTVYFLRAGKVVSMSADESLLNLARGDCWFEQEFDRIADLQVGEEVEFMTAKVERTA